MVDPPVQRLQERGLFLEIDSTNQLRRVALEDFNNFTLFPAPTIATANSNQRPVAMKNCPHLPVRQENIITRFVADQETKSVWVRRYEPGEELNRTSKRIDVTPVSNQLPIAHHRFQSQLECFTVSSTFHIELFGQSFE